MKLIVNADDFGMSKGVNLGILEGFTNGIVTSTSLMTNMGAFGHAIEIMRSHSLDVGIHFTLTTGRPISPSHKVRSLIDNNGDFIYNIEKLSTANCDEIRTELLAQLQKFFDSGFTPTHIDFHHELNFSKNVLDITLDIAKQYNLPMRAFEPASISKMESMGISHSGKLLYEFIGKNLSIERFIEEVSKGFGHETVEIMTHPAYVDNYLLTKSGYNVERAKELEILLSNEVKKFIENNKIELIGFKGIGE